MYPPICETLGQVDIFSDLQVRLTLVRCTPNRDILWPSVSLLWSGWPLVQHTPWKRHLVAKCITTVRLASHQMYPNRDVLCPSVLLLQSGWPLVRCTPRQRHLVAKCNTAAPLCQVDLWSDVPPMGRDIFGQCCRCITLKKLCLIVGDCVYLEKTALSSVNEANNKMRMQYWSNLCHIWPGRPYKAIVLVATTLVTNKIKSRVNHVTSWGIKWKKFKSNHFFLDFDCVKIYVIQL